MLGASLHISMPMVVAGRTHRQLGQGTVLPTTVVAQLQQEGTQETSLEHLALVTMGDCRTGPQDIFHIKLLFSYHEM